jgi:hypothetical protein
MGAIFINGYKLHLYLALSAKKEEEGLSEGDERIREELEKDEYVREALGKDKRI